MRDLLIAQTGENSFPKIKVEEAGSSGKGRTLVLKHYIDSEGRELFAKYAEQTIRHIAHPWGHPVVLHYVIKGDEHVLTTDSKGKKVQTKFIK